VPSYNPGRMSGTAIVELTREALLRSRELTRRQGNRRAFIERARQEQEFGTLSHRIAELKLPTLIIWGGKDGFIPTAAAHRFHADIPGSRLALFEDLGHTPHEEDPGRTAAALKRFLLAQG
jgi:pimeloyl-ACP methyl ester carboxylesterase